MNNQNPARAATPMPQMRREDYKAVKHMDKAQMTAYLQRIYMRGYEAGCKAAQEQKPLAKEDPTAIAASEA